MTRYADICVNLLNSQFKSDRAEVLARARAAGVEKIMLTATDLESARLAQDWHSQDFVYCTAGVHPHDVKDLRGDWINELERLAAHPAVKAIGETGLDFARNFSPRQAQIDCFEAQIALACRLGKPLFVHDRESDGLVYDLLVRQAAELPGIVVHCFTGTRQQLQQYLGAGFYIGITGWITEQKRGALLRELVREIPRERLLVETDAPFLRPHNLTPAEQAALASPRRNEPALLPRVVEAIAGARGEPAAEIAQATYDNAVQFFSL